MRFEAFVALRYLRGKRKTRFISLITMISIAGVSVGVMALIVVMSVMTGFDIALQATIIGNRAHLVFQSPTGPILDWRSALDEIRAASGEITAGSPFAQVEALIRVRGSGNKGRSTGAFVIGVDPELESTVTQLADNLTTNHGRRFGRGELPNDKEIVLGYLLANRLNVAVGDEVSLVTDSARKKVTPFGMRSGQDVVLHVSGISQAQMSEYDTLYAFVNLYTAGLLTGREGVDGIHCKLTDANKAIEVRDLVVSKVPYYGETWYENQQPFFEALQQEKIVMFIILIFIVVVAAFNITSTLIMVVMEKRRDIGVLRTIGVSRQSVLRLFIFEGLYIGLSGTILGVLLGTVLAHNLNPVAEIIAWTLNVDLYNSQIYYFDRIPVAVIPRDVTLITLCSILLSFVSTLYPAWSAARLNPVDALRFE